MRIVKKKSTKELQVNNMKCEKRVILSGYSCKVYQNTDCKGNPEVGSYSAVFTKPISDINCDEDIVDNNHPIYKCRAYANFNGIV